MLHSYELMSVYILSRDCNPAPTLFPPQPERLPTPTSQENPETVTLTSAWSHFPPQTLHTLIEGLPAAQRPYDLIVRSLISYFRALALSRYRVPRPPIPLDCLQPPSYPNSTPPRTYATSMLPMDIDDILADVSAAAEPQESRDLQQLTRAWVAERVAPEVLPWPAGLMDRIEGRIRRQVGMLNPDPS